MAKPPEKIRQVVELTPEAAVERRPTPPASFPIVGIGASAGGLEALERFFKNVPKQSGVAFVVIQHLDPTHKGAMVELLHRGSGLQVVQVKDRQKVEPDVVYVIPPNKDMSIMRGVLHLLPQMSPRGLNLPIDFFFRSLAEDQQERSVAVVLSGMGSDGTLGLRAIKEKAGAGFVQSLTSAKFDGMPRSVIEAGLADVIAPAEELPAKVLAYLQHAPHILKPGSGLEHRQQSALEKVIVLLRTQSGNDFSLYKKSTVYRRIERRMGLHQIDKIGNYVRYLRENPHEIDLLFKELLIGVTSFFRDPLVWKYLLAEALPTLIRERAQPEVLRAWIPGCSTGEEAYSLAILLKEVLGGVKPTVNVRLQIFATDLDKEAIEKARQGLYPASIAADVSAERLRRFFVQEDRGYRVGKLIRETVVFAPQNLITDPPFTKLDILLCRNLLIYLSPELQRKLVPLFHYSLNPGGLLVLGSAETTGGFTEHFESLDGKARVYRRLGSGAGAPNIELPSSLLPPLPAAKVEPLADYSYPHRSYPAHLQTLADRVVVQRFSPAAVLTNDKGDILYIGGRTGKYLEPSIGAAQMNVFSMAREGLRYGLVSGFNRALKENGPAIVKDLRVRTNGESQTVELTVEKLVEPRELRGTVMVVFSDVHTTTGAPAPQKARRTIVNVKLGELERELQQAREELQTVREEMQTSQEELKSTNEEMQSTNEELQSSNEELTTSKEEMQSMNEELQTVNQELQAKVDELSRSTNDMKNLLNSTDIATLFLDGDLLVRRFTTQTLKLIKLIPADAGRPITDFATELDYPDLADDAREVLSTLVFKERQVETRDGRWFTVRIMPYRTIENVIDGIVITFVDSTGMKLLETALREQAGQFRQMAESLPTLVWGCRADGFCDYLGQQWVDYTGVSEELQRGYGWLDQVHPADRDRAREKWRAAVVSGTTFNTEFRIRAKDGAFRWFKTRATPIHDEQGTVVRWYGTNTDIDDLKQAAELRQECAERLDGLIHGVTDALVGADDKLVITYVNRAAEDLLERPRGELIGKGFGDAFHAVPRSVLDEKCGEALREQRAVSFDVQLAKDSDDARCRVHLHPHAAGFWIFIEGPRAPAPSRVPEQSP